MSLSLEEYSEKAIVVRGDTKEFKEQLSQAGGKYNQYLKNGAGWIFSKKNEEKIQELINTLNTTGSTTGSVTGSTSASTTETKPKKDSIGSSTKSVNENTIKTILEMTEKLSCEEKLHLIAEIAGLTVKPKNVTKIIGKTPIPLVSKSKEELNENKEETVIARVPARASKTVVVGKVPKSESVVDTEYESDGEPMSAKRLLK